MIVVVLASRAGEPDDDLVEVLVHDVDTICFAEGPGVEVVSFFVEFEAAVPRLTPAFW